MSESKPPDPLKPGDVVVLKSGGPQMTVVNVSECGADVGVLWFSPSDLCTVHTRTFFAVTLRRPEPRVPPSRCAGPSPGSRRRCRTRPTRGTTGRPASIRPVS